MRVIIIKVLFLGWLLRVVLFQYVWWDFSKTWCKVLAFLRGVVWLILSFITFDGPKILLGWSYLDTSVYTLQTWNQRVNFTLGDVIFGLLVILLCSRYLVHLGNTRDWTEKGVLILLFVRSLTGAGCIFGAFFRGRTGLFTYFHTPDAAGAGLALANSSTGSGSRGSDVSSTSLNSNNTSSNSKDSPRNLRTPSRVRDVSQKTSFSPISSVSNSSSSLDYTGWYQYPYLYRDQSSLVEVQSSSEEVKGAESNNSSQANQNNSGESLPAAKKLILVVSSSSNPGSSSSRSDTTTPPANRDTIDVSPGSSTPNVTTPPRWPDVCPGYKIRADNLHEVDPDWVPSCKEEALHYLLKSQQDVPLPQEGVWGMWELNDEGERILEDCGSFTSPEGGARVDSILTSNKKIDITIHTPLVGQILTPVLPSEVDKTHARDTIKGEYRQLWGEIDIAIKNFHAHNEIEYKLTNWVITLPPINKTN